MKIKTFTEEEIFEKIDALDEFEKSLRIPRILLWIATALVLIGFVGMQFSYYFIISFISASFLGITASIIVDIISLKRGGLC